MNRMHTGIALGLMALLAGVALCDATRAAFEVEVNVTRQEVDALRQAMLGREAALKEPPAPCGDEATARSAVGKVPAENLGDCGTMLLGRAYPAKGPYFITVAPGGVDFTVTGYVMRDERLVTIQASRAERAQILEDR